VIATADRHAGPHVLIVTGEARDLLFEHFARLFDGRSDVRVVKDRRQGERRRRREPVAADRRVSERRHRPPAWVFPPT
jgi:hypothetical protein